MIKIGIIGGGNMGEAILGSIRRKYSVRVAEKDPKRREYLRRTYKSKVDDLKATVASSDVIVLATKPQDMDDVLKEIKAAIGAKTLVISIAAGITTSFIERNLRPGTRVIRTMPNMPAMIGEGVTAVCRGKHAKQSDLNLACRIFDNLGETVVVTEDMIDAITAVSGSGPAYVFYFIESLTRSAQLLGLSEDLAKQLVIKTFSGSINLLEKQKADAAVLRAKVTSKGGTTQAALDVLMKNKVDYILSEALAAAKKRAAELSKS